MLSEPRTISLLCEIVHIPMKHSLDALRDVYARVCSTCGYENFIRTPAGARVERHQEQSGGFSHLTFTGDRLQFTDDHIGLTVDQFAEKVAAVLGVAVPRLRIPVILAQQVTVRLIVTPTAHMSAEEFLGQKLFRVAPGDLERLGRPAHLFGLRLMAPATQLELQTYNVRVEAYMRDRRSLYLENVGTFKVPIATQSLATVGNQIEATSHFLVERVVPFLSLFDGRESP